MKPNIHTQNWDRSIISCTATIRDVIQNLNDVAIQIALITDLEGALIGTISDGDIRRGLLRGLGLDSPIESIIHRNPLVVPESMECNHVFQLMKANKIRQIPVVSEDNRVVGIHLWDNLVDGDVLSDSMGATNLMVIMAGGKGTRLRPHTENCPKPMLKIGGRPMLEHIIERARSQGFRDFVISIHYLGHMVEEYFGNGEKHGVKINYLREEYPMGTAGALSLLTPLPKQPFIVTNGDIITEINYNDLLSFHQQHRASATMAVRLYEWQHPFGVVQMEGLKIIGFNEKPVVRTHVNTGVYALNSETLSHLKSNEPCDMPSLFDRLQDKGDLTIAYPIHEIWLDVGRPDDLTKANGIIG
ncbi:nucleotidyltransferase family protein [Cylindrospermopsis raciborskii]|uniref:nucleotidyltransferase family protein n=1 Tax=Cylindrospermopsis raciborskii TaxID=77022 RepID=UPI0008DC97A0|nr:nucleotidyltransferase family protein [Cylindrospermopsis raciborskii]NLQ05929.1 CBS domain-containing protein [Cylindrospermopsis raciborskii MVCC19]OHY34543.1 nucleotidyl transferase [Cylindrospermopsis raciborskii MVCC14]